HGPARLPSSRVGAGQLLSLRAGAARRGQPRSRWHRPKGLYPSGRAFGGAAAARGDRAGADAGAALDPGGRTGGEPRPGHLPLGAAVHRGAEQEGRHYGPVQPALSQPGPALRHADRGAEDRADRLRRAPARDRRRAVQGHLRRRRRGGGNPLMAVKAYGPASPAGGWQPDTWYRSWRFYLALLLALLAYAYGWRVTQIRLGELWRGAHLIRPFVAALAAPDVLTRQEFVQQGGAAFYYGGEAPPPGSASGGPRLSL